MADDRSPSVVDTQQAELQHTLRGWPIAFTAALILYALTASRGAQWQDSGHHILRVVTGESLNPLGLALSHPLHHWLSRALVTVGGLEPCLAVTLISSLAAAVTIANVYGCVLTLTRKVAPSALAATSLAVAHTFWRHATIAETYTLTTALLSAECWCIAVYAVRRDPRQLWLMGLFNGLGIANHMLASLTTPVIAILILVAWRWHDVKGRHVLIAAALWLVGSLPYSGMVIAELMHADDLAGTLRSAFFGHAYADEVLNVVPSLRLLLISTAFVALSFPNLLLPASLYGMVRATRHGLPPLACRALLAGLILHVCFVARYNIVDQHTFLIPAYVFVAIFGGIGFAVMPKSWMPRTRQVGVMLTILLLVTTPVLYAAVPTVARKFNVLRSVARNKPYRDDCVYLFTPWSVVERSADQMSRQALALAGDDGLILVEDGMAAFAVQYRVLQSGRDAIDVTTEATPQGITEAYNAARPVVLVPFDVDAPRTETPIGRWTRKGDLYLLSTDPASGAGSSTLDGQ